MKLLFSFLGGILVSLLLKWATPDLYPENMAWIALMLHMQFANMAYDTFLKTPKDTESNG